MKSDRHYFLWWKLRHGISYDQMDADIAPLCRALNRFDGILTHGSHGKHPDPAWTIATPGRWMVHLAIESGAQGWALMKMLGDDCTGGTRLSVGGINELHPDGKSLGLDFIYSGTAAPAALARWLEGEAAARPRWTALTREGEARNGVKTLPAPSSVA